MTILLPLESVAQGIALSVAVGLIIVVLLLALGYKRPAPKGAKA